MKQLFLILTIFLILLGCSQTGSELSGNLKNSYGAVIPNATMILHSDLAESKTDEKGNYKFNNIEKGYHQLYGYKSGYFFCDTIEVNSNQEKIDPVAYPGFFSKYQTNKIMMLDRNSGMIKIGEEWRPVIKIFSYNSETKTITLDNDKAYVPSYDLNNTGDSGIGESFNYIWVVSFSPISEHIYFHRYDKNLNYQKYYTFDNPYQWCSNRFTQQIGNYIFQDDVNFISGLENFEVGLRVYNIAGDDPVFIGEFTESFKKLFSTVNTMDLSLDENIITILLYWSADIFSSYKWDVSDPENPVLLE